MISHFVSFVKAAKNVPAVQIGERQCKKLSGLSDPYCQPVHTGKKRKQKICFLLKDWI